MIVLKELSYKIYYIPAYSPEFAPIEMYISLLLKRNLNKLNKNVNVKLSFKHNFVKILNSLSTLTDIKTRKIIGRFIKKIKKQYFII